jgi:DNA-directed RNA polymerase subunit H (RpoH/RPB5)
LEITEKEYLIQREQYYLDQYNPPYNILKIANSLKRYKHSMISRNKLKEANLGKIHSKDTISKMIEIRNSEAYKIIRGDPVKVTDLFTNKTELFLTKTDAAKFFGVHTTAISQREKRFSVSFYRGRYIIEFIKKT